MVFDVVAGCRGGYDDCAVLGRETTDRVKGRKRTLLFVFSEAKCEFGWAALGRPVALARQRSTDVAQYESHCATNAGVGDEAWTEKPRARMDADLACERPVDHD